MTRFIQRLSAMLLSGAAILFLQTACAASDRDKPINNKTKWADSTLRDYEKSFGKSVDLTPQWLFFALRRAGGRDFGQLTKWTDEAFVFHWIEEQDRRHFYERMLKPEFCPDLYRRYPTAYSLERKYRPAVLEYRLQTRPYGIQLYETGDAISLRITSPSINPAKGVPREQVAKYALSMLNFLSYGPPIDGRFKVTKEKFTVNQLTRQWGMPKVLKEGTIFGGHLVITLKHKNGDIKTGLAADYPKFFPDRFSSNWQKRDCCPGIIGIVSKDSIWFIDFKDHRGGLRQAVGFPEKKDWLKYNFFTRTMPRHKENRTLMKLMADFPRYKKNEKHTAKRNQSLQKMREPYLLEAMVHPTAEVGIWAIYEYAYYFRHHFKTEKGNAVCQALLTNPRGPILTKLIVDEIVSSEANFTQLFSMKGYEKKWARSPKRLSLLAKWCNEKHDAYTAKKLLKHLRDAYYFEKRYYKTGSVTELPRATAYYKLTKPQYKTVLETFQRSKTIPLAQRQEATKLLEKLAKEKEPPVKKKPTPAVTE